jgi:hypothetical protein
MGYDDERAERVVREDAWRSDAVVALEYEGQWTLGKGSMVSETVGISTCRRGAVGHRGSWSTKLVE